MKIGILTQPLHKNYGGLLQNYALQQVLLRAGHEVETIDHQAPYAISLRERVSRCVYTILHLLKPSTFKAPLCRVTPAEVAEIRKHTNKFIAKYICCTRQISSKLGFSDLMQENNYDALVVGSDQCWRPRYNRFLTAMFFDFAKDATEIKRVSYAASFGSDNWEYTSELTSQCAELAKNFNLVTVREDSGINLCKQYLGVEAKHVLDPTMLLDKDDYIKLIEQENEPVSEGTLFNYILDPSEKNTMFIDRVAKQLSLKPFKVLPKKQAESRTKDDIKNHIEDCVYPAVTTWLRAFMDAEMIICDSFHGCVFSIIFNKPFWLLGNKRRGNARFDSLLKMFGLENRMIESIDEVDINTPIDWTRVNAIREEKKEYSKKLLLNALKQ